MTQSADCAYCSEPMTQGFHLGEKYLCGSCFNQLCEECRNERHDHLIGECPNCECQEGML